MKPVDVSDYNAKNSDSNSMFIVLVVGIAMVLRIAHLFALSKANWWGIMQGDAETYMAWAGRLANGDWLGRDGFYQAPLYPYVLAIIRIVFGQGVWPVVICQALAGALLAVFVGLATRSLWGHTTGAVAGIMMAMYAPAIYFDGIVQKASLAGLVSAILLFLVVKRDTRVRNLRAFLAGFASAILCLLREHAFILAPILMWWFWRYGQTGRTSSRLKAIGLGLGGAFVVLFPVGLRNAATTGSWSLSTFQAGPNFYIGNHNGADGRYMPLVRGQETPEFERRDATELAQDAVGRDLTQREVSSYWMGQAINFIMAEPWSWAKLMGVKMLLVFNRYEIPDAESQYVVDDSSPILRWLGRIWHFGVLVPLAAVGVVASRRDRQRLWVLYAVISALLGAVALTFVSARYRYPVVPWLIPFAAVGILDVLEQARRFEFGVLARRLGLGCAIALAVNMPVQPEEKLDAMSYMNLGVAFAKTGDLPRASSYFEKAVARHPTSAEANNNLAQSIALQGDYEQAIRYYRAALAAAPSLSGVQFNLGVALERTGRKNDALKYYREAVSIDPNDADARAAVARLTRSNP